MSHGFRKLAVLAGTALAGWAILIRPRTRSPKMLDDLRKYDYAHRGFHDIEKGIPENSMEAFRRAADRGFGIELDVHILRDGTLAVIHDSNLKRLCGADRAVEELTWEEAQTLRLQGTQERIPRLEEVLRLVKGRVPLLIEIKPEAGNQKALCEAVCRVLRSYGGMYWIESFDPRVVAWLKRHEPGLVRGQILTYLRKNETRDFPALLDFLLRNLLTNWWSRPDFIAYHYEERENPSLRLCRKLYRVCQADWTIRTPEQYQKVKKDGSVAIFEHFDPKAL